MTRAASAFLPGVGPLNWLSSWVEGGRSLLRIYCIVAAAVEFALHHYGY